eukprot:CAMPEP_0178410634 /NCGR_PEP_ID=MMETSP0689_2-20121128/21084_1 /TAXON_ID=160604 /ORGANISM="Amphidinium massartii, Strain CS-259" /LENGTH=361 /DNA_ID=CAMNT_0020031823 /DNA_START=97 /DNA_END=1182 /DNA_ORIENTATION=+
MGVLTSPTVPAAAQDVELQKTTATGGSDINKLVGGNRREIPLRQSCSRSTSPGSPSMSQTSSSGHASERRGSHLSISTDFEHLSTPYVIRNTFIQTPSSTPMGLGLKQQGFNSCPAVHVGTMSEWVDAACENGGLEHPPSPMPALMLDMPLTPMTPLSTFAEQLVLPPTPEHWLENTAAPYLRSDAPHYFRTWPTQLSDTSFSTFPGQFHHPLLQVPQQWAVPSGPPSLAPPPAVLPPAPAAPAPADPPRLAVSLHVPPVMAVEQQQQQLPPVQVLCLDEALKLPVSDDGAPLPSLGSADHALGVCKPCAFFHRKGCEKGPQCTFCHLCDEDEVKKRKREKKDKMREMKRLAQEEAALAEQ